MHCYELHKAHNETLSEISLKSWQWIGFDQKSTKGRWNGWWIVVKDGLQDIPKTNDLTNLSVNFIKKAKWIKQYKAKPLYNRL